MGMNKEIEKQIEEAALKFKEMLAEQYERNSRIGAGVSVGASGKSSVVVGLAPGDGIGPVIMEETKAVLEELLKEELGSGRVSFKEIEGFTIENRLAKEETVPKDVLAQMEACDVILKGPTTTPNAAMGGVNLESANVFLRKYFDLFANVRP
ncbi:MAG: isocitrate/isopropylmalate dehydrogenase family protein, partial [Mogibacterium sp.]|nr:isocitrate/isopropylmalate dehydrogenase family protein [Mogibacterium sp.]